MIRMRYKGLFKEGNCPCALPYILGKKKDIGILKIISLFQKTLIHKFIKYC